MSISESENFLVTNTLTLSPEDRKAVRELLDTYFNFTELRTLAQDLDIDPEQLRQTVKTDFTIDLISYCERHQSSSQLLSVIINQRPDLSDQLPIIADWYKQRPIPPNPYRGLAAFREADAAFFYGRATATGQLLRAVKEKPFVVLIGASGSGKSSLVYAGLVPLLKQLQAATQWLVKSFRLSDRTPGNQPFHSLVASLIDLVEGQLDEFDRLAKINKWAEGLCNGEVTFTQLIERINEKNVNINLLLIADQFEELYTLTKDTAEQHNFLEMLLTTAQDLDQRQKNVNNNGFTFKIVLTLRADFFAFALSNRQFSDVLQAAQQNLGPMNHEELRTVIEEPAHQQRVKFEDGLTDRIFGELEKQPGNLPLLEFTLTTLWERQNQRGLITHTAYEQIGGVTKALSKFADEQFARFTTEEQQRARRIFTQLVQPGQGTLDTRRVATIEEVGFNNWELVKRLADTRLVVTQLNSTTKQELVQLVHEALIDNWEILQRWVNEDREFRLWQERLRVSMYQWEKNEKDEGDLLRSVSLNEAENWLMQREIELSNDEREYIRRSIALRNYELEVKEKARLEREATRKRNTQAAVILLMILVALSVIATIQWFNANSAKTDAQNQANIALSAKALAQNEANLANANFAKSLAFISQYYVTNNQQALGLLLSIEALKSANLPETKASLAFDLSATSNILLNLNNEKGAIYTAAFSSDGKTLATGGENGTIRLWDLASGKLLNALRTQTNNVKNLVFSSDGKTLVSSSDDYAISIWDVASGKLLNVLQNYSTGVLSVAISPDGKLFASGQWDGTIKLWNIENGKLINTLQASEDAIYSLFFSPDEKTLAFTNSGKDGTNNDYSIKLLDLTKNSLISTLHTYTNDVNSITFSPDGKVLAFTYNYSIIKLWDVVNDRLLSTLQGHSNTVNSIAFSPDGHLLASGSWDYTVKLWDVMDGHLLTTFQGHSSGVNKVVFSLDGKLLVSSGEDGVIKLWNTTASSSLIKSRFENSSNRDGVNSVAFSPDGKTLVSGGNDNTVKLWEVASSKLIKVMQGHSGAVYTVAFSPDGRTVASGSDDTTIKLWDVKSGIVINTLKTYGKSVKCVAFSPDGKTIASGNSDGTIKLWNAQNGELIINLLNSVNSVNSIAFSPDGKILASSSDDGNVRLWEIPTGKLLHLQRDQDNAVDNVAFSPDGKILASSSFIGQIKLWDLQNGSLLKILTDTPLGTESITFSPDGKNLVSANNYGAIKIWDVANSQLIFTINGYGYPVPTLNFSPDGKMLVSGSIDNTITLWDLDLQSWENKACKIANRNLTKIESEKFFGNDGHIHTCPNLPPGQ